MKIKKWISAVCVLAMLSLMSVNVFAYAPNYYVSSHDLAVVASETVLIDTAYLEGSIYAGDQIMISTSDGNNIAGDFISKEVTFDYPEYNVNVPKYEDKIILDEDTQKNDCVFPGFEIPTDLNKITGWVGNDWGSVLTISEDSYYEQLAVNNYGILIDATGGDLTIVAENLYLNGNPEIKVIGDGTVNFYVDNANTFNGLIFNKDGSPDNVNFYIKAATWAYSFGFDGVSNVCANVYADGENFNTNSPITGNLYTNATQLKIYGQVGSVTGIVCAPLALTQVSNSGKIIGQLHTRTLELNFDGTIIYGESTGNIPGEVVVPTESPVVPTETPAEPAQTPKIPGEIELEHFGYAYIFGYAPEYIDVYDESGNVIGTDVSIEMGPNDEVTFEQVCSMIMRIAEQGKAVDSSKSYAIADKITNVNTWAQKGVGYICSTGAYDNLTETISGEGAVLRGEVAKLVAYGLGLQMGSNPIDFLDVDDTVANKIYIDIMTSNGYVKGDGDTFRPNETMTRAEFCSMFNNVTNRDSYSLEGLDENNNQIVVTPATYYITDMDNAPKWQVRACLLASSAFDSDGNIDIATRVANIRNIIDEYNGQTKY